METEQLRLDVMVITMAPDKQVAVNRALTINPYIVNNLVRRDLIKSYAWESPSNLYRWAFLVLGTSLEWRPP